MNPKDHPVGTRLLLKSERMDCSPHEVTIVEWAPDGKSVKLKCLNTLGHPYYRWLVGDEMKLRVIVSVLSPEVVNPMPFRFLEDLVTNINELYKKYSQ